MNTNFCKPVYQNTVPLLALLMISFAFPLEARADAGLPMLVIVWPAAWALLLPVILIEAFIAKRVINIDYKKALKVAAISNLASTVIGIPVTWIALVIGQMTFGGGKAYGLDTFWQQFYAATVQSPWMIPYGDEPGWMLPAAISFLTVFFFFASVWIEYWAAKIYARGTYDARLLLKWSWLANALSYGLIIVPLLIAIIVNIIPTIGKTDLYGYIEVGDIGLAGVDVFAFKKDELEALWIRQSVNGRPPIVANFFKTLPYSHAVAHTLNHASPTYRMFLPRNGTYIITATCKAGTTYLTDMHQVYWLVPVNTSHTSIRLNLFESNCTDVETARPFKLNSKS